MPLLSPHPPTRVSLPIARTAPPDLENPALYRKVEAVPLLDEHWRVKKKARPNADPGDPDGGFEFIEEYVSDQQLYTICSNTHSRELAGDPGLIFIGHTSKDKPETEQPPLVGYLKNYRMGLHNGRPHILADYYIKSDFYNDSFNVLEQFPRRSVEIYGKTAPNGYIDSVSIQKRAPARDLGLVTHNKEVEPDCYVCECESHKVESGGEAGVSPRDSGATQEENKDDNNNIIDQSNINNNSNNDGEFMDGPSVVTLSQDTLKALIHGIVMGLGELMGGGEEEVEEAPPEAGMPPETPPEVPSEAPKPEGGESFAADGGPVGEGPGGEGYPSGTNSNPSKDMYTKSDIDNIINTQVSARVASQVKAEVEQYSRQTGELRNTLAALQVSNTALVEENRRVKRTAKLEELRDKHGYMFKDFNRELERCSRVSDAEFDLRIEDIRDNYEKSPIDNLTIPLSNGHSNRDINGKPTDNGSGELPADHLTEAEARSNAVWHYAKEEGIEMTQTNGAAVVQKYLKATRGKK